MNRTENTYVRDVEQAFVNRRHVKLNRATLGTLAAWLLIFLGAAVLGFVLLDPHTSAAVASAVPATSSEA